MLGALGVLAGEAVTGVAWQNARLDEATAGASAVSKEHPHPQADASQVSSGLSKFCSFSVCHVAVSTLPCYWQGLSGPSLTGPSLPGPDNLDEHNSQSLFSATSPSHISHSHPHTNISHPFPPAISPSHMSYSRLPVTCPTHTSQSHLPVTPLCCNLYQPSSQVCQLCQLCASQGAAAAKSNGQAGPSPGPPEPTSKLPSPLLSPHRCFLSQLHTAALRNPFPDTLQPLHTPLTSPSTICGLAPMVPVCGSPSPTLCKLFSVTPCLPVVLPASSAVLMATCCPHKTTIHLCAVPKRPRMPPINCPIVEHIPPWPWPGAAPRSPGPSDAPKKSQAPLTNAPGYPPPMGTAQLRNPRLELSRSTHFRRGTSDPHCSTPARNLRQDKHCFPGNPPTRPFTRPGYRTKSLHRHKVASPPPPLHRPRNEARTLRFKWHMPKYHTSKPRCLQSPWVLPSAVGLRDTLPYTLGATWF